MFWHRTSGHIRGLVPPEVHLHLVPLFPIQQQVVLSTTTHQSVNQVPVLIFPSILHTPDYGHII